MPRHSDPEEEGGGFFDYVESQHPAAPGEESASEARIDLEGMPTHLQRALYLALGETPLACPGCGALCPEQAAHVRDLIFSRAQHLAVDFAEAVELYGRNRKFGSLEPAEVIRGIYRLWDDLLDLSDVSEPQEYLGDVGEEEG